MARFQKPVNVWNTKLNISELQPGQWVYAGSKDAKGVFLGQKKSGTLVVAWYGNAKNHKSYNDYIKTLRTYAKA